MPTNQRDIDAAKHIVQAIESGEDGGISGIAQYLAEYRASENKYSNYLYILQISNDIADAAVKHCRGRIDVSDAVPSIRGFIIGYFESMLTKGTVSFPRNYTEVE